MAVTASIFVVMLLAAVSLHAQSTATLQGRVFDESAPSFAERR